MSTFADEVVLTRGEPRLLMASALDQLAEALDSAIIVGDDLYEIDLDDLLDPLTVAAGDLAGWMESLDQPQKVADLPEDWNALEVPDLIACAIRFVADAALYRDEPTLCAAHLRCAMAYLEAAWMDAPRPEDD